MSNSRPNLSNHTAAAGTLAAGSPTTMSGPTTRSDVAVSGGPPQQPPNPRSPQRQQPQRSQPPYQPQSHLPPQPTVTPPRQQQQHPPPQPLLLPDPLPWECPLCHYINDAIQPRCTNQIPPSSPAGYLTDCRGLRPTQQLQPPQRPQFQPRTQPMQYQPTIQSSNTRPKLYSGTPRTLSASDGQFSHQSQPPPFQSPNPSTASYSGGEGRPSNAGARSPSFSSTSPRMQPPSYELTQYQPQPIGPPGGLRAPVEGEPSTDPSGGVGVGYPTIARGFDPRYHQPPPSHSVAIYDPNHPQFSGQVMHPQYQAARVVMDANAQATLARLEFLEEQNRRQAYVFRQHQESIVRIRMARAFFALLAVSSDQIV